MCVCVAVDLRKDSSAAVYHGQPRPGVKPDCTMTMSDGDFVDLATGKLDGNKVQPVSYTHLTLPTKRIV